MHYFLLLHDIKYSQACGRNVTKYQTAKEVRILCTMLYLQVIVDGMSNHYSPLQDVGHLPLHRPNILPCSERNRHNKTSHITRSCSYFTLLTGAKVLPAVLTHHPWCPLVGCRWTLSCSLSLSLWVSRICHRCISQTGWRGTLWPACCLRHQDRLPPSRNQWQRLGLF